MKWLIVAMVLACGCGCAADRQPLLWQAGVKLTEPKPLPAVPKHKLVATNPRIPIEASPRARLIKNTGSVLDQGNEAARQRPQPERFFNAITHYDYVDGSLYQIYAAPLKTTAIILGPGERVSGSIIIGDSTTWKAKLGSMGQGELLRQVIFIKPLMPQRKTNMTIPTNLRLYALELTAFKHSFMSQVKWHYASDMQTAIAEALAPQHDLALPAERLNFNYHIKRRRGRPQWLPEAVFDDGRKTYIRFPKNIQQYELPALFLVSDEQQTQLVNYRFRNNLLIIDRLASMMELRLGKRKAQVVRIVRKEVAV